jgi:hypothetical protein
MSTATENRKRKQQLQENKQQQSRNTADIKPLVNKLFKVPVVGQHPLTTIISNSDAQLPRRRGLEHPHVSFQPQQPNDQREQSVKTLAVGLVHALPSWQPPVDNGQGAHRREMVVTCRSKHPQPDFPAEHTRDGEVINRLLCLRTQGAWSTVLELMSLKASRSPAAVHESQPDEEFASRRRNDLGKHFSTWKRALAVEEGTVGRRR